MVGSAWRVPLSGPRVTGVRAVGRSSDGLHRDALAQPAAHRQPARLSRASRRSQSDTLRLAVVHGFLGHADEAPIAADRKLPPRRVLAKDFHRGVRGGRREKTITALR